jgi:hypothetical protein
MASAFAVCHDFTSKSASDFERAPGAVEGEGDTVGGGLPETDAALGEAVALGEVPGVGAIVGAGGTLELMAILLSGIGDSTALGAG